MFSFQDDDEQWLSLRYDLTAPLARHFAENFESLPKPYRSYRGGTVFRNEKPGPGRFRQFLQFDADTIGSASPAADAELCMMAADTLEKLGIRARRLLHQGQQPQDARRRDGGDRPRRAGGRRPPPRGAARHRQARPARAGRRARCCSARGRKDESGDFTKGAGLDADAIDKVLAFTAARRSTNAQTLTALEAIVATSARGLEGVAELRAIDDLAKAGGL